MLASSWCWSTGSLLSAPAYDENDGTNQCGKVVVIAAMSSPPGCRNSDAPQHPESLETVTANRSSCAPAHSAALPSLECPSAIAPSAVRPGMAAAMSRQRDSPHAQAAIAPHGSPSSAVVG